jgi:hypothetical protein
MISNFNCSYIAVNRGGSVGHNFERDPPKDHPCQVWFNLVQGFQRRRFKCESLRRTTMDAKWWQKLTMDPSKFEHNDHWHWIKTGVCFGYCNPTCFQTRCGKLMFLLFVHGELICHLSVGHNFERDPPKDHPCQVWFNLVQGFQRRRFKCESLRRTTMDAKW